MVDLKPQEIYELELWEFNIFVNANEEKQKQDIVSSILTGFYCAYYTNGGKKAKSPNELIRKIYAKKQNLNEGLQAIEQIKELEKKKKEV